MNNIQIIVGGAAGEGSKKAGLLIAKLFNAYGYKVFIHEDYQSVIKGGHNFSYISATEEEHNATREKVDVVLALNEDTIVRHIESIKEGGILIYDKDTITDEEKAKKDDITLMGVSLNEVVEKAEGIPLMKNTALVAFFAKVFGISFEKLESVLRKELKTEVDKNLKVAETAYSNNGEKLREVRQIEREPLPLLSGNEAVALGAVDAGLECYFAYPMTPSTSILGLLSVLEGVRTYQPESEIAVINAGIGSAYAGRRTMVGTSGGGFALMTEGVSLAAQSETPIVIAMSQRMGPATGVPTYQGQGDLLFVLNSGHGDMMRFVVAPGDAEEAYFWGGKALNVAWKYQLPVVVLLDKELSENRYELALDERVKKEEGFLAEDKENYMRYSGDDISPLCFPGDEGVVVKGTGYEHNKQGIATEDAKEIVAMQNKRIKKHNKLTEEVEEMGGVKCYQEGRVGIIFWGSTKGVAIEATKNLDVKLIQPIILQPFPKKSFIKELEGVEKIICVETNSTGQLSSVLREQGVVVDDVILKYDGRPFTVEELEGEIIKRL